MAYLTLKRNDTNVLVSYTIEDAAANLTGAKVNFVMKRQNGPLMTYAAATIADVTGKQVTYTLKDVDTVLSGIFHAEFAVEFASGQEKSYPQNGYLQIMIQPNADDEKSTYVMDNVAERVSEMQLLKGEMQAQLNNIINMGDSSIEVANARVDDDGRTFTTLKQRLDNADATVEAVDTKFENSQLTNDVGGVKIAVSSTSGDILSAVLMAGVGIHSFYAVASSQNLPTVSSIRGIAQVTSATPTIAYVWAIDPNNTMYTNYIDGGAWKGWKEIAQTEAVSSLIDTKIDTAKTDLAKQTVLWEQTTGYANYMSDQDIITPTKPLSSCRNGWMVVWSDSDDANVINNYEFAYSMIPKYITKYSGAVNMFSIPRRADDTALEYVIKKLIVTNLTLKGHSDNLGTPTFKNYGNDVCIRAVLEW